MKLRKAGIYSPYWNTLGGGEKYLAHAGIALAKNGYEVELWWNDNKLPGLLSDRFGLKANDLIVNPRGYRVVTESSLIRKSLLYRGYDLVLFVSDGSLPVLTGKKNILHFQVPFKSVNGNNLSSRLKKMTFTKVVCNSKFTKSVVDLEYGIDSLVVYPPATQFISSDKEKMIISVGRLDGLMHNKRQDVLVQAFKELNQSGWKLVLLGGIEHKQGKKSLSKLKSLSKGINITILPNPDYKTIASFYGKASIYWHAAGYGVDEVNNPEKLEHFGISTVEAMSAGAVPVVYGAGGQIEIVNDGLNGFLFRTIDELVKSTQNLIQNQKLLSKISRQSIRDSENYSTEAFEKNFIRAIG